MTKAMYIAFRALCETAIALRLAAVACTNQAFNVDLVAGLALTLNWNNSLTARAVTVQKGAFVGARRNRCSLAQ
jgi:hypothetical protein